LRSKAEREVFVVIEVGVLTFAIWFLALFLVSRRKKSRRAAEAKWRRRYDGTWT